MDFSPVPWKSFVVTGLVAWSSSSAILVMTPRSAAILTRHFRVTVRPLWAMGGVIVKLWMMTGSTDKNRIQLKLMIDM